MVDFNTMIVLAIVLMSEDLRRQSTDTTGDPRGAVAGVLAPVIALALVTAATWIGSRRILRRGGDFVGRTRRLVTGSRLVVMSLCAAAGLGGWVDAIRARVVDVWLVDELVSALPFLLAMALCELSGCKAERHAWDLTRMRRLDAGTRDHPAPEVRDHAQRIFRSQMFGCVLMVLLGGVDDAAHGLGEFARDALPMVQHAGDRTVALVVQAADAAALMLGLFIMPLLFRMVIRNDPTEFGTRRTCGRTVRILRDAGGVNAMVVGAFPFWQTVYVTRELAETLPTEQIGAALDHECGHIRHRHMAWLSLACAAIWMGQGVMSSVMPAPIALSVALIVAFLVISAIARQFERHADAYAARSAAAARLGLDSVTGGISPADIQPLAAVLVAAARSVGAGVDRWTLLHGSIRQRVDALLGLVGCPLDRPFPIDRRARRLKLGIVLTTIIVCCLFTMIPSQVQGGP